MALIADLVDLEPPRWSRGAYRIDRPGWYTGRDGTRYFHALLEDRTGLIPAYGWPHAFSWSGTLRTGSTITCTLRARPRTDRMVVDLFDVADGIPDDLNPVQLLPNRALPSPEAVARLQALIERVPVTTLRAFLEDLFSDDAIALPFVERPASRDHHHAYPGGLVEHSLEVAERVAWFLFRDVPTEAKALAVVAGLLHDIGKVRTFGPDYRKTTVGTLLGHDQLTLEILSGPLRRLETKWPDGADSLRYLLSWNEYRDRGRTLIPEALAIRNADRFSAARDAQRRAFAGARSHQRLARLRGYGPPSTFWLPRPPP